MKNLKLKDWEAEILMKAYAIDCVENAQDYYSPLTDEYHRYNFNDSFSNSINFIALLCTMRGVKPELTKQLFNVNINDKIIYLYLIEDKENLYCSSYDVLIEYADFCKFINYKHERLD